ncbi:molybdenum cofactor biosynthesis enzyme MoaA [Paraburkholderia bannensis]|uniref:Molybdenum cofactor biosynthesis enzyme MoaA n=1 Tax=Paraburkholderia bannensis TaxID=765414 RepID=A0A7W9WWK4_9BURK|nr:MULTISPECIES: hypothetical protein [Paraburkholderia]MBB3261719.1 molybdenum cofactor biosynthesis enzyme MoaA [Paraburkholderia sp. WP4_3_2]MBB6106661.1 molybdenum cofactor biosynthesis enzyme MoaA [Paraburkholderia bannensis]
MNTIERAQTRHGNLFTTTSGSLLGAKARALREAALGRETVSLDAIDDQILPIAECFRCLRVDLRFIEYMDVGSAEAWRNDKVVPSEHILRTLQSRYRLTPERPHDRGRNLRQLPFCQWRRTCGLHFQHVEAVLPGMPGPLACARLRRLQNVFVSLR